MDCRLARYCACPFALHQLALRRVGRHHRTVRRAGIDTRQQCARATATLCAEVRQFRQPPGCAHHAQPARAHSRRVHRFALSAVEWYPVDNGMFVSADMQGEVRMWDTNAMVPAAQFSMGTPATATAMSRAPGAQPLVAGTRSGVRCDSVATLTACDNSGLRVRTHSTVRPRCGHRSAGGDCPRGQCHVRGVASSVRTLRSRTVYRLICTRWPAATPLCSPRAALTVRCGCGTFAARAAARVCLSWTCCSMGRERAWRACCARRALGAW